MKKLWTSHEEVMNKLWTNNEQVLNKFGTNDEQVVNKKWTSHEQLWTSREQVLNKLWTNCEQVLNKLCRPTKRSEPFWEQELRAEILLPARDPQFQGSLIGLCPLTIVDIVLPLWMLLTPSLLIFLSLKIHSEYFWFFTTFDNIYKQNKIASERKIILYTHIYIIFVEGF